ncbi:MAG: carbohydrate ABC transporter permease [Actinomycetota bacterium]
MRAVVAMLVALVFVLPLVFMFAGSLREPGLPPPDGFEWIPAPASFVSYEAAVNIVPLGDYLVNSLIVVAVAVPVTVVIASWAGYAIAIASPRARSLLVAVSVVALMVPLSALWVARAAIYQWLGIIDTHWALIAPAFMATTPFYVLIFALAYSRIPKRLYEVARLEGMSPLAIWARVAFPLARPAAFAIAVLAFAWHWSNFTDPLLYISTVERSTLPLGLRALQSLEPTNHPILLAGAVLVTLPPVIAFLSAQRAFFTKTLEV